MRLKFKLFAFPACSLCFAAPIYAQGLQATQALDDLIAEFLGARIGEFGGAVRPVDPRIRLAQCSGEPRVERSRPGTLQVTCAAPLWRITVPVGATDAAETKGPSAMLVMRGQSVTLRVQKSGFSVVRQMVADKSGRLGDFIPLRAERNSPVIFARIDGVGSVSLPE